MAASLTSLPRGPVEEQAAYWFAVLRSERVSAADERAFDLWRAESPAHEAAYERQLLAWEALGATAMDREVLAVRRAALRAGPRAFGGGIGWFAAMAGAASLAAVLATVIVSTGAWERLMQFGGDIVTAGVSGAAGSRVLETAVGERSTAALADGSVVELNTDTHLQTKFTADGRWVFLSRGQVVFEVAQDAKRPFVVVAANKRITALGTQFEVRVDKQAVKVTLIQGRVKVEEMEEPVPDATQAATAPAVELRPGEQFVSSPRDGASVRTTDVERVTSWRHGRLDFEDEPLVNVVGEINRYSMRKVYVEDPSLADLHVSGSFKAGSVDNFTTALIALYPVVRQERREENRIVLGWSEEGVAPGN